MFSVYVLCEYGAGEKIFKMVLCGCNSPGDYIWGSVVFAIQRYHGFFSDTVANEYSADAHNSADARYNNN